MNQPELAFSPCVRLFIELSVDGVGEWDLSEAPTIPPQNECIPVKAVVAAEKELALCR
jgi:hypothetical protein